MLDARAARSSWSVKYSKNSRSNAVANGLWQTVTQEQRTERCGVL